MSLLRAVRVYSTRARRSFQQLIALNEDERARSPFTHFDKPRTTLYTREQDILIVGDGDFSFTHSLPARFGTAPSIFSTSLDPQWFLKKNYSQAEYHLANSLVRGVRGKLVVDATKLLDYPEIKYMQFDVVVFNRAHCGIHRKDYEGSVIRYLLV
ncbi:unnamed protein product [Cuscuta campestris]|nr:unnamed protein product [Cuscuta campestris]